ncbi:MAG: hypothetical protein BGP12_22885 [Rhodospirillales bacterium 70-18]|nr:MAG: hypothetical protein BGP12_22885 [Rhodospirillales bacterium 70-18]
MISPGSLSAFSTANGVGTARQPARTPPPPAGVQPARAQSAQPQTLQARPGAQPQPGQNQPGQPLPRGSLLDLSV